MRNGSFKLFATIDRVACQIAIIFRCVVTDRLFTFRAAHKANPFMGGWVGSIVLSQIISASVSANSSLVSSNAQPTVMVVVGAFGEPEYGERFTQWAKNWEAASHEADAKFLALGLDPVESTSDHDRLKKAIESEPKDSLGELWLILIGHGTFDGKEAKFNLRGPDVAPSEFAEWLQPFQRSVVIMDCTSASGPFLNQLSKAGRIILTATRSGYEQSYSRFGEYISASISDSAADLDKDGQTSLLEAFLMASSRVAEFYKSEGRLATEHPLLDDNGDGRGTPPDWFRGVRVVKKSTDSSSPDGLRAHQIHLIRSQRERELPVETRAQRDKLELEIAKLRESKDRLGDDDYYRQLEPLLIELALLYEKSRGTTAPK